MKKKSFLTRLKPYSWLIVLCFGVFLIWLNSSVVGSYLENKDLKHVATHDRNLVILRHGNLEEEISDLSKEQFNVARSFTEYFNDFHDHDYFRPIPQVLDSLELTSWFVSKRVDLGIVPVSLYKILMVSGNLDDFTSILFIDSDKFSLWKNKVKGETCKTKDIEDVRFTNQNQVFFSNELGDGGKTLYHVLARKNISLPISNFMYLQNDELVKGHLLKEELEEKYAFLRVKYNDEMSERNDLCLISSNIENPLGGYVMVGSAGFLEFIDYDYSVISKFVVNLPKDTNYTFIDRLINANFDLGEISRLEERLKTFFPSDKDLLPKLTYQNLRNRLSTLDENTLFSLPAMNSGMKTGYTINFARLFLQNVVKPLGLEDRLVMLGTSGGAISNFALSLDYDLSKLNSDMVKSIMDITASFSPSFRAQIWRWIFPNIHLFLLLIVIAVVQMWVGNLYFINAHSKKSRILTWYWVFVMFLAVFVPSIQIEYLFVALISWLIISLFLLLFFLRRFSSIVLIVNLVYVFIFFSAIKFPFMHNSMFDSLELFKTYKSYTIAMDDKQCSSADNKYTLSSCLYKKVKYPLVIPSLDLNSLQTINFYVKPRHSNINFPNSSNWVNMKDCPEQMISVVEASSTLPVVFPAVNINCNGKNFYMVDSGMASTVPITQAIELGIKHHFLFWNSPISMEHGFIASLDDYNDVSILSKYASYLFDLFINLLTVKDIRPGLLHSIYLAEPNFRLLGLMDAGGGVMGNGEYAVPEDLPDIAEQDFFSKPGPFTHLTGGTAELDYFYNYYKDQLDPQPIELEVVNEN